MVLHIYDKGHRSCAHIWWRPPRWLCTYMANVTMAVHIHEESYCGCVFTLWKHLCCANTWRKLLCFCTYMAETTVVVHIQGGGHRTCAQVLYVYHLCAYALQRPLWLCSSMMNTLIFIILRMGWSLWHVKGNVTRDTWCHQTVCHTRTEQSLNIGK